MSMDPTLKFCSECGKEIKEEYFSYLDNFLWIKYFDTYEENIFCSIRCASKALMLESFYLKEETK